MKNSSTFQPSRATAKKKSASGSRRRRARIGIKELLSLALVIAGLVFVAVSNLLASPKEHQAGVTFLADDKFLPSLLKDLGEAQLSVDCALYMFKTDGGPTEPTSLVLSAMLAALEKGASVKVYFDVDSDDALSTKYNRDTGAVLERAGAAVIYDSPDRRLHTKMCVIDGTITYVGSHNYTYSAMKRNSEVTVRVRSQDVAADAVKYLNGIY